MVNTNWRVGEPMTLAKVNGKEVSIQYDNWRGCRLYLRHYGNKYQVVVRGSKSAELAKHVPERAAEGQSRILPAPMPGVVKSIACELGDLVEEGSTIVTLEAMKM